MGRGFFRKPSLKKRIAARTSLKRYVRHNLGLKAPRGWGWLTNPKKAAYNRIYYRTSKGCVIIPGAMMVVFAALIWIGWGGVVAMVQPNF